MLTCQDSPTDTLIVCLFLSHLPAGTTHKSEFCPLELGGVKMHLLLQDRFSSLGDCYHVSVSLLLSWLNNPADRMKMYLGEIQMTVVRWVDLGQVRLEVGYQ